MVGTDWIRLDAYTVEILRPDPLADVDFDPVWAQRLTEADAQAKRNQTNVWTDNFKEAA